MFLFILQEGQNIFFPTMPLLRGYKTHDGGQEKSNWGHYQFPFNFWSSWEYLIQYKSEDSCAH